MLKANWQGKGDNPPNYAATKQITCLMSIWGGGIEVRFAPRNDVDESRCPSNRRSFDPKHVNVAGLIRVRVGALLNRPIDDCQGLGRIEYCFRKVW
jgi:hypothetical protein